jgi:hypothetical protein
MTEAEAASAEEAFAASFGDDFKAEDRAV